MNKGKLQQRRRTRWMKREIDALVSAVFADEDPIFACVGLLSSVWSVRCGCLTACPSLSCVGQLHTPRTITRSHEDRTSIKTIKDYDQDLHHETATPPRYGDRMTDVMASWTDRSLTLTHCGKPEQVLFH